MMQAVDEGSRAQQVPRPASRNANDEAAWLRLRLLLHRLPAALRYAQSAETAAIAQELIQEIENRLDEPE
jgi:hypothetical protein